MTISPHHLGGYQLCLYDHELYGSNDRDRLDPHIDQLKTATAVMALKGASQKSHGFAFLWKDHNHGNYAPYSITILNLAPFQSLERFFHSYREAETEIPKTTKRFIELAKEYSIEGHSGSLDQITDFGTKFLENICSPQAEAYFTWDCLKDFMLENSDYGSGLVEFHSWGIFSELLSEKTC